MFKLSYALYIAAAVFFLTLVSCDNPIFPSPAPSSSPSPRSSPSASPNPSVAPIPVAVNGVSLDKSATSIVAGTTESLTATVTPVDASNKNLSWESVDTTVATVNSTGVVTGVAPGSTLITVRTVDGNMSASCTVTVISNNADLSSLVADYVTGNAPLSPPFNPAITTYTANIPSSVSTVAVSATKAHVGASVVVSPNYPVALTAAGDYVTFTITVTAQGGAIKIYKLTVFKASYTSANIGNLMLVPAGTFQRDATVTNTSTVSAFRMSEKEITRSQFAAITGFADPANQTYSSGTGDPVQQVSWYQALVFCNRLSMAEGLTPVYTIHGSTDPTNWIADSGGAVPTTNIHLYWDSATVNPNANGYRLPTEMEWMWAAMGATDGTTGYLKEFAGDPNPATTGDVIENYAWVNSNSNLTTHPGGEKLSNELGLYDMSGNVFEFCWDRYGAYPAGAQTNYQGAVSGTDRVLHGGSKEYPGSLASIVYRYGEHPYYRYHGYGFRVVRP